MCIRDRYEYDMVREAKNLHHFFSAQVPVSAGRAVCLVSEKHYWKAHPNAERFKSFLFLFRLFVASLLSINLKSSIRFAWWVHISEVKYYDGKRQVSEFARFEVFPILKKWTRYRQKTERGTSFYFVSTRRSRSGISNEWAGNDCSRLCPASIFLFFQYRPNFAIKSMLCPKLHILGLMLPDFGVHF